jgi:O-antigen ligase
LNKLLIGLVIFGMVLIQCLIGGTRLVFSLPTYGFLALAGILSVFLIRRSKATPSLTCLIVSTLFFGYILTRAALTPIGYLWWTDYYMVLGCLLVYVLTAFYITTPAQRSAVVAAFLLLAVVHVFVGLRQFTVGDEWMPFGFIRGTGNYGWRASGMLIHSIHLAGYLEAVGVFALSFAFWSTWKTWARIVSGYIALICYLGVAITGSRGGYVSVAFSLLVFTVLCLLAYRKTRPQKFPRVLLITCVVFLLGLGAAVGLMTQSDALQNRLNMLLSQVDEKQRDVRIYNWQAAIDQFKVEPIYGTGAGTHLHYGRLFRRPIIQADPVHAHSDYLELLAEYGLVGAGGMAAFLLVHLASSWRASRQVLRQELRDLSDYEPARHDVLAQQIGGLSAVSAYLVHSISDFNLHIPGNALLFAFIFGMMASPAASINAGRAATVSRLFRWFLPALGAYGVFFVVQRFPGEYYAEKTRVALRNQDFPLALQHGQAALERESGNPFIYFYIGNAFRGMARDTEAAPEKRPYLEAAIQAYTGALSIFPQDEDTLIRMGQALGQLGHFKEAEKAYLKAIEMDPKLGLLHAYYARHLSFVGREREAEQRFAQALTFDGTERVRALMRGTVLDPSSETQ